MFFDYYTKIVAEQQKEIENTNKETETKLEKAKKLAKKKQVEVFEDIEEKNNIDETTENKVIDKESEE